MAESDVTAFTILWTIILFIFFAISLALTIYSFIQKHWTGNRGSNWKFVFATAMSFLIGSFTAFINYILVLIYGWSEGNISEYIFWLFTTCYTVSLFMAIYLWIKRLAAVFAESAFALNTHVLKLLKIVYFALVILGFITLILFFVINNSIILWTLSGLWTLLFAIELTVLQSLFIHKLVKLRRMAEATLKSSHDEKQLKMIQRVWFLQVKLTILATTTIVSTVFALIVSFNVDLYYDLVPFGIDSFIGFICIYCALKQHNKIFSQICIICVKCCDICCKKSIIDNELTTQIEIHSQTAGHTTQITQTFDVSSADKSKTNKSNSGDSNRDSARYSNINSDANVKSETHIPRPSTNYTHDNASNNVSQEVSELNSQDS